MIEIHTGIMDFISRGFLAADDLELEPDEADAKYLDTMVRIVGLVEAGGMGT